MIIAPIQSWLKQLFSSLFIRMLLITFVALASYLLVFFGGFRSAFMFPESMERIAGPMSRIVQAVEAAPPSGQGDVLDLFSGPTRVALVYEAFPEAAAPNEAYELRLVGGKADVADVAGVLAERELRFRYTLMARAGRELPPEVRASFRIVEALEVSVELKDGRVLAVLFSPAAVLVDRRGFIGALLMIAAIAIGIFAGASIHTLLKPLKELEAAADRFGATFNPEPIEERGSTEVRRLAKALNRTQDQVRNLINERAEMISALAHDICTSLTRVRLRVEGLNKEDKLALTDDIDQMSVLIDDMLTYAKSGESQAAIELIELQKFVATYAEEAPWSVPFESAGVDTEFTVAGDPVAFTRALNNLVDNAIKYGGAASIICEQTNDGFMIHIDDQGPGIPPSELSKVVEPFYRLEPSRSRLTGGSGMGLGIAKGLAEANGGVLILSNRQPNGLRATLFFPKTIEITH